MIYEIRLTITHKYAQRAGNSRHLLRVLPRLFSDRQQMLSSRIDVFPLPDYSQNRVDFFANAITTVTHSEPHSEMAITMACSVGMAPPQIWKDISSRLSQLPDQVRKCRDLSATSPVHFLGPSYRLAPNADIAAFARDVTRPDETVAETTIRLGEALHQAMTFDATATTVHTSAPDAFAQRRGVCQDFTHIMIVALRSLCIPAGYVSGYLRTLPPPGQPRLEGVDAMHAWVQAWCGPDMGWIEYDPTNATLVGTDHIVVGYGRDYADVSPILGRLRLAGAPVSTQTVDVACIDGP